MKTGRNITRILYLLFISLWLIDNTIYAQNEPARADTIQLTLPDSLANLKPATISLNHWRPNPKKAMWMALVIPGGGQIYNRKYWKLPIVYGGFVGCTYALTWNNQMYKDYSKAYLDIMDNDPNTKSYEAFLPWGTKVDASNMERMKTLLKSRKDTYRRYRDLSIFAFVGVYLLSVIDAYVDAELSSFDINDELSLKIEPTVINAAQAGSSLDFSRGGYPGIQCSLKF